MSDEKPKKTATTLEGLVAALPAKIFRRDALAVLVTLAIGAAGYAWAQSKATERVEDVTAAKVAPLKKQVEELSAEFREVKAQINANEARAAERFDVLYRAMFTGRRDSRADELATPAPQAPKDGGP